MKSVSTIEKITLVFVFTMIIVGLVSSYVSVDLFEKHYINEDGAIEWLTVVGLVLVSCVCFYRSVTLRSKRPSQFIALTLLLGFVFLFVAGEEISWGQRIFQFQSPDWFLAHNRQEETSIHNLQLGQFKVKYWIFDVGIGVTMFLYVAVMMTLYGRKKGFAREVDRWAVPSPQPYQLVSVCLMVVITQLFLNSSETGELTEFGGVFLVLLIIAFPRNQVIYEPETDLGPAE